MKPAVNRLRRPNSAASDIRRMSMPWSRETTSGTWKIGWNRSSYVKKAENARRAVPMS